jgi:SAM-dependent methyltransferase
LYFREVDRTTASLYALIHRGSRGDRDFYRRACAGGARVLELGSGAGRMAIELANRGHHVTGIDIEPELLAIARAEAAGSDGEPRLRWLEGDMRSLSLAERFDRVVVPYNTLCCLLSNADLRRCMLAARDQLEPSGKLVFDIYRGDPDSTVDDTEEHLVRIEHEGKCWDVFERAVASRDPMRADTRYRFAADDGEELVHCIEQRLIDDEEMLGALAAAGFSLESKAGGFDGEPLDDESPHLVVVARR